MVYNGEFLWCSLWVDDCFGRGNGENNGEGNLEVGQLFH